MKYKRLGRTGLKVSEVCLGTMTFGSQADEQASKAIVKRALDAGVNFFDTANVYNAGVSEEFTGRALQGVRRDIVLATKLHGRMGPAPNDAGQSRKHIIEAVEQSLRRLGTDYIDLYQVHRFDPDSPLDETLGALDDLVRSGKVRYIGASNYAAWQLCTALWTSDKLHLARYDCIQPRYNLISRAIEQELLPLCQAQGVGGDAHGAVEGAHERGESVPGRADDQQRVGLIGADQQRRAQMPQQGHEAVGLGVAEGDGGRPLGLGLRGGMVARPETRRDGRGLHSTLLSGLHSGARSPRLDGPRRPARSH